VDKQPTNGQTDGVKQIRGPPHPLSRTRVTTLGQTDRQTRQPQKFVAPHTPFPELGLQPSDTQFMNRRESCCFQGTPSIHYRYYYLPVPAGCLAIHLHAPACCSPCYWGLRDKRER